MATVSVAVFLYHSIAGRGCPSESRWTLSPRAFSSHVAAIASAGCTALTVTELGACLRGERGLPPKPVVLTFDDGYADVVSAVEQLADRGLSSTIYVTSGRVGAAGMLSRPALAQLGSMPMAEVGSHAIHHDRLDELSGPRLIDEVRGSKSQLEDLIQAPVTSFAYPHGAYSRRAREAVIAADYRTAAAVKNALSHRADDPFAIARWTVTSATSAGRICELLEGRGAPRAWRRERVRTRASRTVRRLKRLAAGAPRADPR